MIGFTGISVFIVLLYFILIYQYYLSWKSHQTFTKTTGKKLPLSIVIPFYNESANLKSLIKDLRNQAYSSEWLEIILVDDYSEDTSFQLARNELENYANIQLLKNQSKKGKKYALKTGVEKAKNDIIVISDADCRLSENWIPAISGFFSENPSTMLLSSGVVMRSETSFAGYFQSLEFASLVASGAASFFKGSAIMCNGANLAFKKELFLEAFDSLHPGINTGDDMFLMLYTKKKYPGRLSFLKSLDAFTRTHALPGWRDFITQRLRWSSKSSRYRDAKLLYVSFLVLFVNLILASLFVLSFFNLYYAFLFFAVIVIKSIPDFTLLRSFLEFSKQDHLLKFFIPSQLINIFFIPLMGIMGLLNPIFRKGNK